MSECSPAAAFSYRPLPRCAIELKKGSVTSSLICLTFLVAAGDDSECWRFMTYYPFSARKPLPDRHFSFPQAKMSLFPLFFGQKSPIFDPYLAQ
jgi:hypothetical protein